MRKKTNISAVVFVVFSSLVCPVIPVSGQVMTTLDDYTFANNYRIETNNWTFNLMHREYFNYNCVILDYRVYYLDIENPVNEISFIDIAVGVDWVIDNYDDIKSDILTAPGERYFQFVYSGNNSSVFFDNITNIHAIARNEMMYETLNNLIIGDVYEFNGYLVDISGNEKNGSRGIEWNTGTEIGDEICEIVVLGDSRARVVSPAVISYADVNIGNIVLFIGLIAALVVIIAIYLALEIEKSSL